MYEETIWKQGISVFQVILILSFYFFVPAYFGSYTYPANIQTLGWFVCVSSVVFIPLGAAFVIIKGNKRGKELVRASPDFCPAHVRKLREKENGATKGQPVGVFRYTYDNEGFHEPSAKVSCTNFYYTKGGVRMMTLGHLVSPRKPFINGLHLITFCTDIFGVQFWTMSMYIPNQKKRAFEK